MGTLSLLTLLALPLLMLRGCNGAGSDAGGPCDEDVGGADDCMKTLDILNSLICQTTDSNMTKGICKIKTGKTCRNYGPNHCVLNAVCELDQSHGRRYHCQCGRTFGDGATDGLCKLKVGEFGCREAGDCIPTSNVHCSSSDYSCKCNNGYTASDDNEECKLENLALGKPAEQSSTYVGWGGAKSLSADLAVDGNRDTNLNKVTSSCMHTHPGQGAGQWWRVDLQNQHSVHAVTITNRGDCCGDRLRNFKVFVDATKTSPGQGRECVTVATIPQGATVQYTCSTPITGRYVTVYLPVGILQLCEVQVFGSPATQSPLL